MLRTLDQLVKYHGDGAQDNDGSDDHIELEHLRPVDNQIAETASRGQKFPYDNAHERKADVDFHTA